VPRAVPAHPTSQPETTNSTANITHPLGGLVLTVVGKILKNFPVGVFQWSWCGDTNRKQSDRQSLLKFPSMAAQILRMTLAEAK